MVDLHRLLAGVTLPLVGMEGTVATILDRIDATIAGRCPCGAEPVAGSAWCSEDCRPVPGAGLMYFGEADDLTPSLAWIDAAGMWISEPVWIPEPEVDWHNVGDMVGHFEIDATLGQEWVLIVSEAIRDAGFELAAWQVHALEQLFDATPQRFITGWVGT